VVQNLSCGQSFFWVFFGHPFEKVLEVVGDLDAFENIPEALFVLIAKTFKVWILRMSLSEWSAPHNHKEEGCSRRENVSLHRVIQISFLGRGWRVTLILLVKFQHCRA
jgi:hypothetical protein